MSVPPDGPAEDAGVALGSATGDFIVLFRANDGMDIPDPFTPAPGPGVWEPTPPAFVPAIEPQMSNVTPFTIRSRDQFFVERPPGRVSAISGDFTGTVTLEDRVAPQSSRLMVEGSGRPGFVKGHAVSSP